MKPAITLVTGYHKWLCLIGIFTKATIALVVFFLYFTGMAVTTYLLTALWRYSGGFHFTCANTALNCFKCLSNLLLRHCFAYNITIPWTQVHFECPISLFRLFRNCLHTFAMIPLGITKCSIHFHRTHFPLTVRGTSISSWVHETDFKAPVTLITWSYH